MSTELGCSGNRGFQRCGVSLCRFFEASHSLFSFHFDFRYRAIKAIMGCGAFRETEYVICFGDFLVVVARIIIVMGRVL